MQTWQHRRWQWRWQRWCGDDNKNDDNDDPDDPDDDDNDDPGDDDNDDPDDDDNDDPDDNDDDARGGGKFLCQVSLSQLLAQIWQLGHLQISAIFIKLYISYWYYTSP